MKVAVIGGGPAGLYFSLLLKQARPDADITVLERNRPDDTFGWGVVFSDQTLGELSKPPIGPPSSAITASFAHWDDIDVHVRGRVITSGGHGFAGIARKQLLNILQTRCADLGVAIRFETDLQSDDDLARLGLGDADVVVAADGINSAIRTRHAAHFKPDLLRGQARFIWLGTTFPFQAFTFYFVENEHGVFQAHCYRFDEHTSTFIVECDEESWRRRRLRRAGSRRHGGRLRAAVRAVAQGAPADDQRAAHGRALGELHPRPKRLLVPREHRPHRRRGAHRAFLDRVRHQARDGGRDCPGARAGGGAAAGRGASRPTRTSA